MDGKGRMGPCVCMAKSLRCSSGTVTTLLISDQFSSVAQSCLTLCDPVNCSTPGFPVYHQLPEFTQNHVNRVCVAIQPSHPLSSPSQELLKEHQFLSFSFPNHKQELSALRKGTLINEKFTQIRTDEEKNH